MEISDEVWEIAQDLYNEADIDVNRYGQVEDASFMDFDEYNGYYKDCDEADFNKAVEYLNSLLTDEVKFYTDYNRYLELSDNHTLWSIDIPEGAEFNDEDYNFMYNTALEHLQDEIGVEVFGLGRSGRHICVEDNFRNLTQLDKFKEAQDKWEDWLIETVENSFKDDTVEEAKELAPDEKVAKCLSCGMKVKYRNRDVQHDAMGDYIECPNCKSTFDVDYDNTPTKKTEGYSLGDDKESFDVYKHTAEFLNKVGKALEDLGWKFNKEKGKFEKEDITIDMEAIQDNVNDLYIGSNKLKLSKFVDDFSGYEDIGEDTGIIYYVSAKAGDYEAKQLASKINSCEKLDENKEVKTESLGDRYEVWQNYYEDGRTTTEYVMSFDNYAEAQRFASGLMQDPDCDAWVKDKEEESKKVTESEEKVDYSKFTSTNKVLSGNKGLSEKAINEMRWSLPDLFKDMTDEQKQIWEELSLRGMVMSCLIYGDDIHTSTDINAVSKYYKQPYVNEYYDTLGKDVTEEIIKQQTDYFNKGKVIQDVGTDSDGLSYNSFVEPKDESRKVTEAEDMTQVKDAIEAAVEKSDSTDLEKDQVKGSIDVLKTDEESAIEGYEDFKDETEKVADKELADAVNNQMEEIIDDEKEHIEKLDTIKSALGESKKTESFMSKEDIMQCYISDINEVAYTYRKKEAQQEIDNILNDLKDDKDLDEDDKAFIIKMIRPTLLNRNIKLTEAKSIGEGLELDDEETKFINAMVTRSKSDIEDFLGYDLTSKQFKDKQSLRLAIKEIYEQMPDEEFNKFKSALGESKKADSLNKKEELFNNSIDLNINANDVASGNTLDLGGLGDVAGMAGLFASEENLKENKYSDVYKYKGKAFSYNKDDAIVEYVWVDPDTNEWVVIDEIGLSNDNWEDRKLRDAYLDEYIRQLDDEANRLADDFISNEYLGESLNQKINRKLQESRGRFDRAELVAVKDSIDTALDDLQIQSDGTTGAMADKVLVNDLRSVSQSVGNYLNKVQEGKDLKHPELNNSVKAYYADAFGKDELNADIKEVTFLDLYRALKNKQDVYDLIGVRDSVVRERLFAELARILNQPIAYVNNIWQYGVEDGQPNIVKEDKETGTIRQSLNTGVLPIVNVDLYSLYSSGWFDNLVLDDDSNVKFDEIIQDIAPRFIKETLQDILPSVEIYATGVYHPREYNYGGDELEFDLVVNANEYNALKEKALSSDMFETYLKDNYSSRSGFISSMPDDIDEFNNADEWKQMVQVIMFALKDTALTDVNEAYLNDFSEAVNQEFPYVDVEIDNAIEELEYKASKENITLDVDYVTNYIKEQFGNTDSYDYILDKVLSGLNLTESARVDEAKKEELFNTDVNVNVDAGDIASGNNLDLGGLGEIASAVGLMASEENTKSDKEKLAEDSDDEIPVVNPDEQDYYDNKGYIISLYPRSRSNVNII